MSKVKLYLGDCLEILPTLDAGSVDAVVTDPPYGINWCSNVTKGKNSTSGAISDKSFSYGKRVVNDDKHFDPSPFLSFDKVILWGFHHYLHKLLPGSVLVWLKRYDSGFGSFLSDADLAWMKGGYGVYAFRDLSLQGDHKRLHPTQKPIPLMVWCVKKVSGPTDTILDPFMGSGTTGVACVRTGRNFIGIEIDPNYFSIAEQRINAELEKARQLEMALQME